MRHRILQLTAIAVCLACEVLCTSAQCPEAAELNITPTLYTQENGLASNMLVNISKDSIGYRYFLAIDGKWMRYDGVNFSTKGYDRYSFFHYEFREFATDQYTKEYMGTATYKNGKDKNGVARKWGISGDSLIWIDTDKDKREGFRFPAVLTGIRNIDFFPGTDICWLSTHDRVFRFDIRQRKFVGIDLPESNSRLRTAPLLIFSCTRGPSFLLLDSVIWKLSDSSTSLEKFCTFSQNSTVAAFPEIIMNRYFFMAAPNAILYEADLENASVTKVDLKKYTSIKNANALVITSLKNYKNLLLIGTSNAGLFIFDRCRHSMQHFQYEKQNAGELTSSVAWIQVDDENVIWMQTEAGLIKLEINNQQIKTYMPSTAKSNGFCNDCNNVRAIYARDNDNLLIGSLHGVYNFELTTGKFSNVISPVDGKPVWNDIPISAITGDHKGNIFIGSWRIDGIYVLNNETKKLNNIQQPKDHPELSYTNIRCLLYDSHGVLWVGTNEGILRITNLDEFENNDFKAKTNVVYQFPERGEQSSVRTGGCFALTEAPDGKIWIGSVDGLYVYNYKTDDVKKYAHGGAGSISDNEVRSIYFSGNNDIWIGTNSGGLNHFDVSKKTFTSFTTDNGLPNNSIYTILEDRNGFLWLGTNAGLCRFNKTDHSVRNYTPRDGIQNFEFNTNAVAVTKDGRFCFGGRTGFNIFSPDSMNTSIIPPQVVITGFKIFDKEFPVTNSVLHLAHDQNSFTFDFAVLNYYRSNDNQFAYMLEGADKDWIKSGNRQYTSYNNLSPGDYTFKVRAANFTGLWNEGVTEMKFIIYPAWYNTFWFRAGIIILIAAGIYGFYRYRLNQVRKLQAVRNRIASDLHDEIGSTLSSISLSSTIIQSKLNGNNTEVEKLLQQVSSNTDNMMEALSDIVWAINTRNDRFDNVVNRMRAFAIEILEPRDIAIQFNVSEDVKNTHLDMQQRKNLYLIFKEAVNNIAKYSGCKNVCTNISRENKTLLLDVTDDGKGFDVPVLTGEERSLSGNGIRNMRKRAEELGGEIIIDSAPGKGTGLHLSFTV
jgi:ligand-binding sensor domain-containing protein/two-component sensor histidine kinase